MAVTVVPSTFPHVLIYSLVSANGVLTAPTPAVSLAGPAVKQTTNVEHLATNPSIISIRSHVTYIEMYSYPHWTEQKGFPPPTYIFKDSYKSTGSHDLRGTVVTYESKSPGDETIPSGVRVIGRVPTAISLTRYPLPPTTVTP